MLGFSNGNTGSKKVRDSWDSVLWVSCNISVLLAVSCHGGWVLCILHIQKALGTLFLFPLNSKVRKQLRLLPVCGWHITFPCALWLSSPPIKNLNNLFLCAIQGEFHFLPCFKDTNPFSCSQQLWVWNSGVTQLEGSGMRSLLQLLILKFTRGKPVHHLSQIWSKF